MDNNLLETYMRTFIVYLVKAHKTELNAILVKNGMQSKSVGNSATLTAVYEACAASPAFRADLEALMGRIAPTVSQQHSSEFANAFGDTYTGGLISGNISGILNLGTQLLSNGAAKKANQTQVEVANLQLQAVKSNNEAQLQLANLQAQLLSQQASLGTAGSTAKKTNWKPILLIGGGLLIVTGVLWLVFRKKQ